MSTYILIVVFISATGGTHSQKVEGLGEQACRAAAAKWESRSTHDERRGGWGRMRVVADCFPFAGAR